MALIEKERRSDDILIKRTEILEAGHKELKKAIDANSQLTNKGFDEVNLRFDEIKGLMELYQSTRLGAKFVAWIGSASIAMGTLWILIRDVLHIK